MTRSGEARWVFSSYVFIWIAFIFAIPWSLWLPPYFLFKLKMISSCIYVYVLAPARLWRSHHLETSRSLSLAPRPLIFWPTGFSAALSVSEHWRSPADRRGYGVAGRAGGCRTLGKPSEVMHFSIRFWLTFFFTKMDTQCSITSWISVPFIAADRSKNGGDYYAPFYVKEAEPLIEGGGAMWRGGAFEMRRRGYRNIAKASVRFWEHYGETSVKTNIPFLILVKLVQTVQGWFFFFLFLSCTDYKMLYYFVQLYWKRVKKSTCRSLCLDYGCTCKWSWYICFWLRCTAWCHPSAEGTLLFRLLFLFFRLFVFLLCLYKEKKFFIKKINIGKKNLNLYTLCKLTPLPAVMIGWNSTMPFFLVLFSV